MSILNIPLSNADANQTVSVILDGVLAVLNITTTDYGLFMDITYGGASIARARVCQDRRDLNPYAYQGLPQPLFFADLQGTSDPTYDGFNTRYLLCYGTPGS